MWRGCSKSCLGASPRFGKLGFVGVISSRNTVADFTARKRIEIERDPEMSKIFYLPPIRTSWSYWPERRQQRQRWKVFDAERLCFDGEAVRSPERRPQRIPCGSGFPKSFGLSLRPTPKALFVTTLRSRAKRLILFTARLSHPT